MWPNVTGTVEAKFAVESKATHMGPEAAAKAELMLQIVVTLSTQEAMLQATAEG